MHGLRAWCRCVFEDAYAVGACQLLENELKQSRVVHVVVHVFLAYGVHGRVKFTAIVGFGGCLNVSQQHECELWDTNDDTILGHLCRVQLHQLQVDADLLAKVEVVVDNLKQLLQHIVCGWLIGAADGQFHHFIKCEFVDAFVVAAVGHPEVGIGDVAAD